MIRTAAGLTAAVIVLTTLIGCDDRQNSASSSAERPPPAVVIAPVVSKPVAATAEFVGQTEAYQLVDLRARVKGFLREQGFKEGATVKKGDVLFVIDPSEYVAAQEAAAAKVAGAKATLLEAENQLRRYSRLEASGTFSPAQLDTAKSKAGQARAELAAAEADLKRAELDVGYTKIVSPIDGQIGSSSVDVGNLVGPDSDILATVIDLDPIHVNFSVPERAYLDHTQARAKGEKPDFTPRVKLANDQDYPHDGTFDYIDNKVDSSTGTIRVRAKFPNSDGLLLPGQFVNVTLVSSDPKQEIVVPQAAVQENQTGPFVLVVDDESKVELRPVKTGQREGADIVALEGLSEGEQIIVQGIQKVRPGMVVKATPQSNSKVAK